MLIVEDVGNEDYEFIDEEIARVAKDLLEKAPLDDLVQDALSNQQNLESSEV